MERRTFLEMSLAAAAATRLPRIAAAWRRREQSGRRLPGNEATAPSDQRERPESGLEYPALGAGSPFAPGFLWGAASSAYQIEGAATADGKGESVWDEFVRRPGVIAHGDTGREACDFYHRYASDIARMRQLGLGAFRFSLAWTRILPSGRGPVNQRGLDFYRRLVDALLAAGIEPVATLFHWDTPLALEQRGGWRTRAMAEWFADYAAIAAAALGDRVHWWLTINEPRSFIGGGFVAGVQAPGLRLDRREALATAHHVLLAHGRAVEAVRAHAAKPVRIGLPNDCTPVIPEVSNNGRGPQRGFAARPACADNASVAAARAATFATPLDHFTAARWWDENAWWHDPVYLGAYPPAALHALAADAPDVRPGDMASIAQPLDFIASNIYGGRRLRPLPPDFPRAANGWPIEPEAMEWAPRWLHERYRLPVFITENGCATDDHIAPDGAVPDPARRDFTARYLESLARAARAGTPLLGYLHWSLLDNFEWQQGYSQRFGLIYVDFPTQRRILKDSARWFASVLATRGASV